MILLILQHKNVRGFLFVVLALWSWPLGAQPVDTLTVVADTLIVRATRSERPVLDVPYAVDVLNVSGVNDAGLSLQSVLQNVSGVGVDDRHNLSQGDRISIRGIGARASFGVRGVRLVLDGIPLTMPDGQSQLNNVDVRILEKVEVLKGPSSSLYGNASGGVILMRSKLGGQFRVVPSVQVGAYGFRRGQVFVAGQKDKHQFALSVHRLVLDGFREHANAKTTNAMGHWGQRLSERVTLRHVVHFVDSPYLLNPSSLNKATADSLPRSTRFFVKMQGAGKSVRQVQGGTSIRYDGDGLRGVVSIYGLMRELYNPIPGRIIDLNRRAWGLRSVVQKNWRRFYWTMGVDVEAQHDTRAEFENDGLPRADVGRIAVSEILGQVRQGALTQDQNERVVGTGIFLTSEWVPNKRWRIVVGGRFDRYGFWLRDRFLTDGVDHSGKRTMGQMSPSVGITFRPSLLTALYAHWGTAFQTPTTSELGNRPTGEGGFNPDLEPEKIQSFELGAKGFSEGGSVVYRVAVYGMQVRDILIPFQVQIPDSEEIFYRNVAKARNFGAEVQVHWSVTRSLKMKVMYSGQNFKFLDNFYSGGHIPGVPQYRLGAEVAYHHRSGFYVSGKARFVGESFGNNINGAPQGPERSYLDFVNESYAVVDLESGYDGQLGRIELGLYIDVKNVFNQRYNSSIVPNAFGDRFFEPAPGRIVFGGVKAEVF